MKLWKNYYHISHYKPTSVNWKVIGYIGIKVDQPPIPRETRIWIYECIPPYWFVYFLDNQMRYALAGVTNRSTKNT